MNTMNNQNMTGQELKNLRLKHLKAKKDELSTQLSSASLPEDQRAAVTARQEMLNERIATITTKLEQKPEKKRAQQGLTSEEEQSEVAALKAQRADRARAALEKPGPLQRAACVESELAHVRTVLANPTLPPQRQDRLEAKEKGLSARLEALLGPSTEGVGEAAVAQEIADAANAKCFVVEEVSTATDPQADKRAQVEAKLAHVQSVLSNPALPAERRLRLEAKDKILTARLQEISAGGGGKGQGGGGKGQGGGGKGAAGKGTGKDAGKGGKGHGKGKGKGLGMGKCAEETCGSGDE